MFWRHTVILPDIEVVLESGLDGHIAISECLSMLHLLVDSFLRLAWWTTLFFFIVERQ